MNPKIHLYSNSPSLNQLYGTFIRERSVSALCLLYIRSIPALYQLVYWVLPLNVRATGRSPLPYNDSSKFVKFLIHNS